MKGNRAANESRTSFWFAVFSPLIGIVLGFAAVAVAAL
jgi:hypothetical protein